MKYLTTLYSFRHICHFLPMILLTPPQYKSSLTTIYFVPSHLPHFCWGAFLTPLPYQTHLLTHPHQTPRVHFNSESFQFCPRRPRLCATHAVSAATLAVLKVASRKSGKKKEGRALRLGGKEEETRRVPMRIPIALGWPFEVRTYRNSTSVLEYAEDVETEK